MILGIRFNSILFNLLLFILGAFIAVILSVTIISQSQLTRITDKSQSAIYSEKIDIIWSLIKQEDDRLKRTGFVELYSDDFKAKVIKKVQTLHLENDGTTSRPLIFNEKGEIVVSPSATSTVDKQNLYAQITSSDDHRGQFTISTESGSKWYIYKHFRPWNWVIVYGVPIEVKYADVKSFSALMMITLLTITLIAVVIISILVTRLIKPVGTLTNVAMQLAEGDLNHHIDTSGKNEIGTLAKSFDIMRHALRDHITKLNNEIVQRENTQYELRELRNYLKNIIDSMPSILIGLDSEGRVTQWNKTAENMTSIAMENAYQKKLIEVLPRMDIARHLIEESISSQTIQKISNNVSETENGTIYEDITIYPLESGGETGVVIRVDDVTRDHEMEMKLNHSSKMDAIGQLAGGIAHDFNNVLGGILGAAQILKISKPENKEQNLQFINMIEKAATRAADLTNNLLTFSRKGKIASNQLNIHNIIQDTIDLLSHSVDKKVTILTHLNAEHVNIQGDPSGIHNAMLNIGINGCHAMPDGGELIITTGNTNLDQHYCDISGFQIVPGDYVEIEIRDTGCGIPQENQQKIFEPFFTTKEQGVGVGLGLAAVYGTIKDHRGAVHVYSEMDEGTTFRLLLPCSTGVSSTESDGADIITGSGRILLVDDEEIIRDTGKELLEKMGYEVILAKDGKEATHLILGGNESIDLVIMDMIMPVMNGIEAIAKIREKDKLCKIIIASGFSQHEQLEELERLNVAGFIRKPYRANELGQLLSATIEEPADF